jgi:AcrR family transcriptional regulator
MKTRRDGEATREAILEAACLVFGEKGFYKATHAAICRTAGVNNALINFHFGTKDGLYRTVWERVTQDIEQRYPIDGGVPPSAPAAQRLYGNISSLLNRALDPHLEGFHRLRAMESINPTGMLDQAFTAQLQTYRSYTKSILKELLGSAADSETVDLCEMSVISQCHIVLPPLHCKTKTPHHRFVHSDVEHLARHITCFSLAGINAIRNGTDIRRCMEQPG